jgi:hypothetical protein
MEDPESGAVLPRRSLINSFGAGGSYANLIIEEYNEKAYANPEGLTQNFLPWHDILPFIFSANAASSLFDYLKKMTLFLENNHSIPIEDVSFSLLKLNHNLDHRAALLARSREECIEKIAVLERSRESNGDMDIYMSYGRVQHEHGDGGTKPLSTDSEKNKVSELIQSWVGGQHIDFMNFYNNTKVTCVDIPKYAFKHGVEHNDSIRPGKYAEKARGRSYRGILEKLFNNEISREEALASIEKRISIEVK